MAFLVIYPRVQEGHFLTALCCTPFAPCSFSPAFPGEGQNIYSRSGNPLANTNQPLRDHRPEIEFPPLVEILQGQLVCRTRNSENSRSLMIVMFLLLMFLVVMEGEGGEVLKSDPALWESPHKMQIKIGQRSGCSH